MGVIALVCAVAVAVAEGAVVGRSDGRARRLGCVASPASAPKALKPRGGEAAPSAPRVLRARAGEAEAETRLARVLGVRGGEAEEDGEVVSVADEEELQGLLEQAGGQLVVLDFYADRCKPCKKIAPLIEALAAKPSNKGKVLFLKVDVDKSRELATQHGVESMPTILFFRGGKQVDRIVGADKARLKEIVARATMPPLVRAVSAPGVIVGALGLYLLMPWGRIFQYA